jgi:hypothetical protein
MRWLDHLAAQLQYDWLQFALWQAVILNFEEQIAPTKVLTF